MACKSHHKYKLNAVEIQVIVAVIQFNDVQLHIRSVEIHVRLVEK